MKLNLVYGALFELESIICILDKLEFGEDGKLEFKILPLVKFWSSNE
jgi:hypothetical protein